MNKWGSNMSANNSFIGATGAIPGKHKGKMEPVDFVSKKMTDAENKMGITEKEFLAMGWAIEKFDYYLRGRKFKVITDHIALVAMKTKPIFGNVRLESVNNFVVEPLMVNKCRTHYPPRLCKTSVAFSDYKIKD